MRAGNRGQRIGSQRTILTAGSVKIAVIAAGTVEFLGRPMMDCASTEEGVARFSWPTPRSGSAHNAIPAMADISAVVRIKKSTEKANEPAPPINTPFSQGKSHQGLYKI